MIDVSVVSKFYITYPPGNNDDIKKIEEELGLKLPDVYIELLRIANGFHTNDISIFGTDSIIERNLHMRFKNTHQDI